MIEFIKIEKDFERAKSLVKLVKLRLKRVDSYDIKTETPLIVESKYEIIKELITAILFCEGLKTLSHIDLIKYLKENHKEFDEEEIDTINKLRKARNSIVYYGEEVPSEFLSRKEQQISTIINKLKTIVDNSIR